MSAQRPAPIGGLFENDFWDYLSRGEYRLQRCDDCGSFRYPPAPCCPDCLSEAAHWDTLSGRGTIVSWTRFHRQYFDGLPPPYVVVSVATAEGPMVIGNLIDAGATGPAIGADVRLTLESVQTAQGEIWLPQWTTAKNTKP